MIIFSPSFFSYFYMLKKRYKMCPNCMDKQVHCRHPYHTHWSRWALPFQVMSTVLPYLIAILIILIWGHVHSAASPHHHPHHTHWSRWAFPLRLMFTVLPYLIVILIILIGVDGHSHFGGHHWSRWALPFLGVIIGVNGHSHLGSCSQCCLTPPFSSSYSLE